MYVEKEENQKFYFKIGELETITGVPANKIRYWTKKYSHLQDQLRTNSNGIHRLYHKKSIEIISKINLYLNEVNIKMDRSKINEKLQNAFQREEKVVKKLKEIRKRLEKILDAP